MVDGWSMRVDGRWMVNGGWIDGWWMKDVRWLVDIRWKWMVDACGWRMNG